MPAKEKERTVVKRSGRHVPYSTRKIYAATRSANKAVSDEERMSESDIMSIVLQTDIDLRSKDEVNVEEIQDTVENVLMRNNFCATAKAYILYRQKHAERREASKDLMKSYNDLLFTDSKDMDLKRDNANINTDAPMGIMLKLGAEGAKCWAKHFALPEEYAEAHAENWIHLHDLDFSFITSNCMQIYLADLLKDGFNTGHGFLREPGSIRSAAALACIAVQSNQNDQFGGQSICDFDTGLAPYVNKSFRKHVIESAEELALFGGSRIQVEKDSVAGMTYKMDPAEFRRQLCDAFDAARYQASDADMSRIYEIACRRTEDETMQAMEATVHNFNSLHSRAGGQVPFSSVNFGLDTTPEGRLVTDRFLDATWNGLGNGETPIFPISIMRIRRGIDYEPGDPNYDLFRKACRVSAKRLFPNFLSCDASYNDKIFRPDDPRTWAAQMGCRTRVATDVNGPDQFAKRGNFAFVTINLPKLAIEAHKDMGKFWKLFDKYIRLSKKYLEYRYNIIAHKKVKNFPFLMGQGVYEDSEKLGWEDEVGPALRHCSISIGFCGLAECLIELTGKHHGESKEAQRLGLDIVRHLREMTDKFTEQTHMNWSTFASPAENTAGEFQRSNREKYGIIPGVTDRDYMTNSFHVPVYYRLKAIGKIRIEAPYHKYCNAGAISYIEMDGDPVKNVQAFETIVRAMHDNDMGYFSINHPVDRDPVCGYTGLINNECPHCHRREDGHYHDVLKKETV